MMVYLVAGICFIIYLLVVFLLGALLKLHGGDFWVFGIVPGVLGAAATAAILYFLHKRKKAAAGEAPGAQDAGLVEQVDFLIREANARLAASSRVTGGKRVGDLPIFLFAGDPGSTKTTVVVHSGLEAELLAGEVYRDNAVASTAAANLWFAGGNILAEAGGRLATEAPAWSRLVNRLRGRRLANLLGRTVQAPRAAIVCFDCEEFTKADAVGNATAAGRRLRLMLAEAAQQWGSRLPVYVLFTKVDRLPYFTDFVRNLAKEEASQAFGVTLPISWTQAGGVWAEQAARQLGAAFDELFLALAEKRPDYLRRENDGQILPNVYEFPREFRKLREHLIRFLLELSRPSQLRAMPFLRGFYFTGVRPITIDEVAPVGAPLVAETPYASSEATLLFKGPGSAPPRPAYTPVSSQRRVPQWVFLSHFFTDVLLQDRTAIGASGKNTRASLARRILLASATGLLGIFLIGATVSYFNNRALLRDIRGSVLGLSGAKSAASSPDSLRQLEQLRQPTADIAGYDASGAPLRLRWGLYPGHELAAASQEAYCAQFRRVLLGDTLAGIRTSLRGLPATPGPNDNYETSYSGLKAYLMATSQPGKTDPEFLTRTLVDKWSAGREVPADQLNLARQQFQFYSERRAAGFCPAQPDNDAIVNARAYLLQFKLIDRAYQNMLTEASRQSRPVTFLDPGGAIIDRREVEGAFTKSGWKSMQAAITKAPDYLNREPWVLGQETSASSLNAGEIVQQLRKRYSDDFIAKWQQFLEGGGVARYASLKDASQKLTTISAPQSPLLRLFCVVSENTAVDSPDVTKAFQPIHALEAPATCATNLNSPSTAEYMRSLLALQVAVDRLAGSTDTNNSDLPESGQAKVAARTTGQNLNLPPVAQKLIEQPILYAEDLAKSKVPAELDGKGRNFCAEMRPLLGQIPFDMRSSQQAGMAAFANIFQPPTGRLWGFYNEALQTYLVPRGAEYVQAPDSKVTLNESFVRFFNRAAGISRAFYPGNAPKPNLAYSFRVEPSDVDNFTLQIDGVLLKGSKKGGESQQFTWPGDGSGLVLKARARNQEVDSSLTGPWSVFEFTARANRETAGGAGYILEWDLVSNTSIGLTNSRPAEKIATLRLYLDMKGAAPVLHKGYLASLGCTSKVAGR